MRLPCEMIRDLLPLYHDGVCSEISKTLVQEHVKTCPACQGALETIGTEMTVLKPEVDEARPLKSLKRKWRRRNRRTGLAIGIGVFLVCITLWFNLTQSSSVTIGAEEYAVKNVVQLSNGMYYLEYSHPYKIHGICADIHRTADGAIHIIEYRPRLGRQAADTTIRDCLIDPEQRPLRADTGEEVPLTAFYLGCPDKGDALLLWSADMEAPTATPEQEREILFQSIGGW